MAEGLADKAVIVTGAASGIGAAALRFLVAQGANVVAADINAAGLDDIMRSLGDAAAKVRPICVDLADEPSIVALVTKATQWLGKLEGLVNVAADLSPATLGNDGQVDAMSKSLWQRVLDVNLIGTALMIREAMPHLRSRGGASIVNISSIGAWMSAGPSAYASSKSALHSLTRHVAREGGPDSIRCNAVAPGVVMTDAALRTTSPEQRDQFLAGMAMPRLGHPDDIASIIAFLLDDRSSWITGQIIAVDGGLTMRE